MTTKQQAARANNGKPKLEYLLHLPKSLETLCRIFEFGGAKYEELNWKKGNKPDEEYLSAALRHLFKFVNGETFDSESHCNHLGHAVWNLLVLLELNYPNCTVSIDNFNKAVKELREQKCQKK